MLNYTLPSNVAARRLSTPPLWLEPHASQFLPPSNDAQHPPAMSRQTDIDALSEEVPAGAIGSNAPFTAQSSNRAPSSAVVPRLQRQHAEAAPLADDLQGELLQAPSAHVSQLASGISSNGLQESAELHVAADTICSRRGRGEHGSIQDTLEDPASGEAVDLGQQRVEPLPVSSVDTPAMADDPPERALSTQLSGFPSRPPAVSNPDKELHRPPTRLATSNPASAAGPARPTNPFWHHHSRSNPVAAGDIRPSLPAEKEDEVAREGPLQKPPGSPAQAQPEQARGAVPEAGPLIPQPAAIAALVTALACRGRLEEALQVFGQLQQDPAGLASVTLGHSRNMWQSLIEVACRRWRIDTALEVTLALDWRSTGASWLHHRSQEAYVSCTSSVGRLLAICRLLHDA